MQRFAAFCLRKNGAIIFTTVLLPFYYHEIAENSVNTVPFSAFFRDLPRFVHKNLRNAKDAVTYEQQFFHIICLISSHKGASVDTDWRQFTAFSYFFRTERKSAVRDAQNWHTEKTEKFGILTKPHFFQADNCQITRFSHRRYGQANFSRISEIRLQAKPSP